jgi:hypothetical protein
MHEWPNPYSNCPGYQQPTGPALVVQLGPGNVTPRVTGVALSSGDEVLEVCTYNETNYTNSNAYEQGVGRSILNERDAVVIIPRQQLIVDREYTITIAVNGETYQSTFNVVHAPPQN